MPAKNATKFYVEDGYYHIYNRGVNKNIIFQDSRDYAVFMSYIKEYLSPRDEKATLKKMAVENISAQEKAKLARGLTRNNFCSEITLLAYCLMPNHFHFFIKQKKANAIEKLMRALGTRYSIYFNRAHNRVGTLYQGVYKAALITEEGHYLHLSRYIHRQALGRDEEGQTEYPSSYPEYLGLRKTDWVHPEEILAFFADNMLNSNYRDFVTEHNPVYNIADGEFELEKPTEEK